MDNIKKPLIILTGPTAVGKTDLSIRLAREINGEIISADSMQVYKKMDIGTAKIKKEEMQGIPHYLVDVLDPAEDFNVVVFQEMAKKAMEEIYRRGKVPIVVGGTGFYIQALLYDIDFSEHDSGEAYRAYLQKLGEEHGNRYLYDMLCKVDEEYAKTVHANNTKKVIRALEYYKETGQKLSAHNKEQREKESPYEAVYLVLSDDRKSLYQRIDRRVDEMIREGLVEEVQDLVAQGYTKNMVSMQGLGYKEFFDYFDNKISLEEVIALIKRDTRHFAKRQLTWFRREKNVVWFDKSRYTSAKELFEDIIKCIEVSIPQIKNERQ